jgi:hypothetical protein
MQPGIHWQSGHFEEPAGKQVMLDDRDRNSHGGRGAEQGGGRVPVRSATAVCFGAGESSQTELFEHLPEFVVEINRIARSEIGSPVCRKHRCHHVDDIAIDGCGRVHQRSPSSRAKTPSRISLVPPRRVKPGRCRMARSTSSPKLRSSGASVSRFIWRSA